MIATAQRVLGEGLLAGARAAKLCVRLSVCLSFHLHVCVYIYIYIYIYYERAADIRRRGLLDAETFTPRASMSLLVLILASSIIIIIIRSSSSSSSSSIVV